MPSARRTSESKFNNGNNELLLSRFHKQDFFRHILRNVQVDSKTGKFLVGEVEWYVSDYFETIFRGDEFRYVSEFEDAINEFLRKHLEKISSFTLSDDRSKHLKLDSSKISRYLILSYPHFNPSLGVVKSMADYEVYMWNKVGTLAARVLAGYRKVKRAYH